MAEYTDIFIDQGSQYLGELLVDGGDGLPYDITGFSARGQIRKTYKSKVATSFSIEIKDPTSGILYITLTGQQTAALKRGRHVYDIEIYTDDSPENKIIRVSEGQVHVTPRVTQP